jgi:hypothetical protein
MIQSPKTIREAEYFFSLLFYKLPVSEGEVLIVAYSRA